jgi:hypothetical protein
MSFPINPPLLNSCFTNTDLLFAEEHSDSKPQRWRKEGISLALAFDQASIPIKINNRIVTAPDFKTGNQTKHSKKRPEELTPGHT